MLSRTFRGPWRFLKVSKRDNTLWILWRACSSEKETLGTVQWKKKTTKKDKGKTVHILLDKKNPYQKSRIKERILLPKKNMHINKIKCGWLGSLRETKKSGRNISDLFDKTIDSKQSWCFGPCLIFVVQGTTEILPTFETVTCVMQENLSEW